MNLLDKLKQAVVKARSSIKKKPGNNESLLNTTLRTMLTESQNRTGKNVPAVYRNMPEGVGGYYRADKNAISINGKLKGPIAEQEVWPHELAHALFTQRRRAGNLHDEMFAQRPQFGQEFQGEAEAGDRDFVSMMERENPIYTKGLRNSLDSDPLYSGNGRQYDFPSELFAYPFKAVKNRAADSIEDMLLNRRIRDRINVSDKVADWYK